MNGYAFSSVSGLKHRIKRLDNCLNSQCREILKLVYKQVESFEELAKRTLNTPLDDVIDREVQKLEGIVDEIEPESDINEVEDGIRNLKKKINSFTPREDYEDDADDYGGVSSQMIGMREVYQQLKDKLMREDGDDYVDKIDPKSDIKEDGIQHLKKKINSITPPEEEIMKYSDGLYNTFADYEDDRDDYGAVSSEMIGMREVYQKLKDMFMSDRYAVTSLVGMPGIGKTAMAHKFFNDPMVVEGFDKRVWVRVGKKYRAKDIPRLMLEEIDLGCLQSFPEGDEESVAEHLNARLKSKRYLIVLDDVWDRFTMLLLRPYYYSEHSFLHRESQSQILITSRLQQLDPKRRVTYPNDMIMMRLLSKEESWDLFCKKVFSQGSCPPQFEKVGKKICKKCDGLPLTILAIARLLSPEEKKSSLEFWNEVATKKNHQIFTDAYDEISKVLLPSYTYLPRLLQMCFMFIGLFPIKYEVPRSKLFNLWCVDGFFELNAHISSDKIANECLEELVSNSVVMVYQHSSFNYTHKVKTCGLHSSFWHLSKRKAMDTKFALILSSRNDILGDGIEGHMRLSFQNNVLFGIKDVHESVENKYALFARSLYCFGPYHQYEVPLCFRLKLVRELDALSIRFYEFPKEVLQLVQLTYLSLTSNGMIPDSISQLKFLEFLIVDRHQNIKHLCKDTLYLPVEIWSLRKLKHLQVMGSDLPDPHGASLECLESLSDVSARSCTDVVLNGILNVKALKIRIELAPDEDSKPLICFGTDRISHLRNLHSLKCVIVNPEFVPPVATFSRFLEGAILTNLSLSGFCYPWKEMRNIASLPCLAVLKLKNYAFQGPEWEIEEDKFRLLRSLVIEDTDLVDWKIGSSSLNNLKSLILKQCYKLKKIHVKYIMLLDKAELVDCNPSCVEEVKKVIYPDHTSLHVIDIHASCDDRKPNT